ncbi:hypothetical protein AXW83_23800 [Bosea sp. PAMC 26642]|nr:hypothetical protein AXW83_23800 [Bosea sp. PAMC 26642]
MRILHAGIASGRESETIDALVLRSLRRADRDGVSDIDIDALSSALVAILNLQVLNVLAQRLGKDMDLVLLVLGQGGQKKAPHWFDALTHAKTLLAAAAKSCVDAEDARIRAQLEVLNQLGHSAAMLDVHMDIVASNDLFEKLLTRSKSGGISGRGRAPVYDSRVEAGLRKLARSTASHAALPAHSGCGPILMQKIRVAIDPAVNLFAGAEMLAIVSEIQQARVPSSGIIQDLFELTPAEARVAAGIASGARVEQLANGFNVSAAAIRFHLKSVFLKTSTHRQAELAALLNGVQLTKVLG